MQIKHKRFHSVSIMMESVQTQPKITSVAEMILAKAENKTKRQWRNAWKKPQWKKAAAKYHEAAKFLISENQDRVRAKEALLKSYECLKKKREWDKAGKTLEQIIRLDIKYENFKVYKKVEAEPAFSKFS